MESTYKENLLQNARYQMSQMGGKVMVRGKGNDRTAYFTRADGHRCTVWYPMEGRVNDLEIADMKEVIEIMSGQKAFSMSSLDIPRKDRRNHEQHRKGNQPVKL